jgi:hypothetical protein
MVSNGILWTWDAMECVYMVWPLNLVGTQDANPCLSYMFGLVIVVVIYIYILYVYFYISIFYMKKGGTLYVKKSHTDKVEHSIKHIIKYAEDIKAFGASSLYGFNIRLTIPERKSRFVSTHMNDVGKVHRHFMIKFSLLSNDDMRWIMDSESYRKNPSHPHKTGAKMTSVRDEFMKEANVQQSIFLKSSYLGYPICPPVIAATSYKGTKMMSFINDIAEYCSKKKASGVCDIETEDMMRRIRHILTNKEFYTRDDKDKEYLKRTVPKGHVELGVIVMELLQDYKILKEFRLPTIHTESQLSRSIAATAHCVYALIRLCYIGYYHGDIHSSNIMVNIDDTTYIDGEPHGHAMIIDFGRTVKINTENAVRDHPVYEFFNSGMMSMDIHNLDVARFVEMYLLRNEDAAYYEPNNVKPENAFIDKEHIVSYIGELSNRTRVYDMVKRIIEGRRRRIDGLRATNMLDHFINLSKMKGDMFDIMVPYKIKYGETSFVDLDLILYIKSRNADDIRRNAAVVDRLNKSSVATGYEAKIVSGRRRVVET